MKTNTMLLLAGGGVALYLIMKGQPPGATPGTTAAGVPTASGTATGPVLVTSTVGGGTTVTPWGISTQPGSLIPAPPITQPIPVVSTVGAGNMPIYNPVSYPLVTPVQPFGGSGPVTLPATTIYEPNGTQKIFASGSAAGNSSLQMMEENGDISTSGGAVQMMSSNYV